MIEEKKYVWELSADEHALLLRALENLRVKLLNEAGELADKKLARRDMDAKFTEGQKHLVVIREIIKLTNRLNAIGPSGK